MKFNPESFWLGGFAAWLGIIIYEFVKWFLKRK